MSRRSNVLALGAGLAGLLAVATVAVAQTGPAPTQPNSSAEARLAWAKRHVELVCRPLEEQKMFDKATRCYNDVARLMGTASRETPVTAQSTPPAAKPSAATAPAVSAPKARPAARPAPVRTAVARPAPVRIAAAPLRPRPVTIAQTEFPAGQALSVSGRCSGMSCLRYTLLGVGF